MLHFVINSNTLNFRLHQELDFHAFPPLKQKQKTTKRFIRFIHKDFKF